MLEITLSTTRRQASPDLEWSSGTHLGAEPAASALKVTTPLNQISFAFTEWTLSLGMELFRLRQIPAAEESSDIPVCLLDPVNIWSQKRWFLKASRHCFDFMRRKTFIKTHIHVNTRCLKKYWFSKSTLNAFRAQKDKMLSANQSTLQCSCLFTEKYLVSRCTLK